MVTRPKPVSELAGLVYGATDIPSEGNLPFIHRPGFWAAVVIVIFVIVNIIFW